MVEPSIKKLMQTALVTFFLVLGFAVSTTTAATHVDDDPVRISNDNHILDSCASFGEVEVVNREVRPVLRNLVLSDYFKYYKVDLSPRLCPFQDEEGMCGNEACAVESVHEEDEIPEFWRSQYLGRLAEDSIVTDRAWDPSQEDIMYKQNEDVKSSADAASGDHDDRQKKSQGPVPDYCYCYPEDESLSGPGVYINLPENPERFTGYGGPHANKVWRAVYQENCFGYYGDPEPEDERPEDDHGVSPAPLGGLGLGLGGQQLEGIVMDSNRHERQEVGGESGRLALNAEKQCIEQRLFYRILSGMHASVSAHLCYESLNQSTGKWSPNRECFMSRVGRYPERLNNLFFNYAVVSRAVAKLRNYIGDLVFVSDDPAADRIIRRQMFKLTELAAPEGDPRGLFNEKVIFASPEGRALKDEFRTRVKNVNALMSCVGCDRCRLWGKLQTAGYGTALKVLFELPPDPAEAPDQCLKVMSGFKRSELVALINTFDRLSKSVEAVEFFTNIEPVEREPLLDQREADAQYKLQNGESSNDTQHSELEMAWEGLKFILQSYIDFPKNLYYLAVKYSVQYWDWFTGRRQEPTTPIYQRGRLDL